jgi:membrane fusion protein (multidrug efflux system)
MPAPAYRLLPAISLLPLLALVAACGDAKPPAAAAPPAPQVGVISVQPGPEALEFELPGRVEALRTAQVRARVSGVVLKNLFREGSDVKPGQLLMQIDAAPYRATLASTQAQLLRAEANAAQAKLTAERYAPLVASKAISPQDYSTAEAARKSAEADVAAARAAVDAAKLNVGYASVTAPIAGRIGRALVTEGALVSSNEATPLALVQQIDRVYVNFTQSSGERLAMQRALSQGKLTQSAATVQVLLEDGSAMPQAGKLLFSDLTVDAATGQVSLRAEQPNPQGLLLPGQFVRVRVSTATLPEAVKLPQQAVTRSPQGDTVLVLGADAKAQVRPVQIAGARNGQWIVSGGLKAGEQVIVDGFQKMGPPGAVALRPIPWTAPGAASTASAASR